MANLLIPPQLEFVDQNGAPLAGGTLETYIPGTTTPKNTFQDSAETILNANPIVLDVRGACVVYGDGDYRLILRDSGGTQVFDLLSSEPLPASAISAAMLPVVGALTLQQARDLMGVTAAIQAAVTNISLMSGPTGPAGALGPQGVQGPTGPSGADASFAFQMTNPGFIRFGALGTAPMLQFGSSGSDGSGNLNVAFAIPFPNAVNSVQVTCQATSWWANVTSIGTGSFSGTTSSPLHGGSWTGGPIPIQWFAVGY